MAGFKTHLSAATAVGGAGSISLLVAGQADPRSVLLYLAATIIGGVLPDIDSDTSTPLHIAFSFFSILFSFLVMFSQGTTLSVVELLIVWLMAFLFFKWVVFQLFIRITVHRGIIHSIPAGLFFGFLTAIFVFHLFHLSETVAWITGMFVFIGYMVHLLLDELYSLNLLSPEGVKHSWGSAFKLFSRDWKMTAIIYVATIGLFFLTPSVGTTFQTTLTKTTLSSIHQRFLPKNGWFGTPIKFGL